MYIVHCTLYSQGLAFGNCFPSNHLSPYFKTFMGPMNRFQGIDSASLCSLAGRYHNPIHNWFLVLIDCLKIPALVNTSQEKILVQFLYKSICSLNVPTFFYIFYIFPGRQRPYCLVSFEYICVS
jgi:hypothetical protein